MKMKKILSLTMVSVMALGLVACGSSSDSSDEEETTAETTADTEEETEAEDTEEEDTEAEEEEEEEEEASSDLSGSISTNGSTSMESVIGALNEQFMADNPDVTITYDATGSGTGIEAVLNGTTDIGLASRDLKDEEVEEGLVATTLALDGIVVIVNEDCPVDDLSLDDIYDIFTGEVTDWSEYGGEGEIACIGREAGSGTRDGFESITGTEDLCVLSQELTSTGAVIEAVNSSSNAIGYASYSAVEGQEGIKAVTIDGVECTEETISDGSYVIQRPFNLVTMEGVELSDVAQAYFDWITSTEANDIIAEAGAVPVAE